MPAEIINSDERILNREVTQYLRANLLKPKSKSAANLYDDLLSKLRADGDINAALTDVEIVKDARKGIVSQIVKKDPHSPIFIRDCRNAQVRDISGPEEKFEGFLNAVSAAQDILEIEQVKNIKNLKSQLLGNALRLGENLKKAKSQAQLDEILAKESSQLVSLLEENGIKDPSGKLNLAVDYQGFKRPSHNYANINQMVGDDNETHTVVDGEIAYKQLTAKQCEEVADLEKSDFVSSFEKALIAKHRPAIIDGKHVIPARKHVLPGQTIFTKVVYSLDDDELHGKKVKSLKEISRMHHSQTPVYRGPEHLRDKYTKANLEQAETALGSKVHLNLLNGRFPRPGNADREIVKRATKANGRDFVTTSCVNVLRYFGLANDYKASHRLLGQISRKIDPSNLSNNYTDVKGPKKAKKALNDLKEYLAPKGFFGKIKAMVMLPNAEKISRNLDNVHFAEGNGDVLRNTLRDAIEVKQKLRKADSFLRVFDGENSSLEVVTGISKLTNSLQHLRNDRRPITPYGVKVEELPNETALTCCTLGCDRTGLAVHEFTSNAIKKRFGNISQSEIDQNLSKAGSASYLVGSSLVGFGFPGAGGLKQETKHLVPAGKKEDVKPMIDKSPERPKFESLSLLKRLFFRRSDAPKVEIIDDENVASISSTSSSKSASLSGHSVQPFFKQKQQKTTQR